MQGLPVQVNLLEKYMVNLFSNVGSKSQELPINPMQDCLEEIPLPWILTVKQLKQLPTNRYSVILSPSCGKHSQ